ncbi:protoporphyrinogen oxidase [Streptomyces sp. MUM 203J]|uniref:protoporphyrinogen oxidase n=1 Tax=Streptomyces sp. MUM 203J TaxID=2791990 RepID=UPI001F043CAA|nr:protoporphyrinogen oxidase [Streptomyces sp. MUM 203J]MCH0538980.1 protoporphyrinogen oxidase [Streptomyces sp. MUM 203J]
MNVDNVDTPPGRVVVVGGGIAGLAAAHRVLLAGRRVTLLEATGRLGGKLHAGDIAGAPVDLGAESMLARRPEGIELATAVGLGGDLQPPATAAASVWTRGVLRPMPKGHVMGVPGGAGGLGGLLSDEGLRAVARDRALPPADPGEDVAIGAYVAQRMGHEIVDRLVEPLLGGVYAGDAYRISMKAAVPRLLDAVRAHGTLTEAVGSLLPAPQAVPRQTPAPVFTGLRGGIGRLPLAVAEAIRERGGEIRTETPVHALTRRADGWEVRTDTEVLHADAVILAAPAWSASALLAAESPAASAELAAVEYASMSLVTLAFRRADLAGTFPAGSGFLVPPVDGRTIKASTFASQKWQWIADGAPDLLVLRTSLGRYGEESHLAWDDAELVAASLKDLGDAVGLTARPVATRVVRWIDGLPQYPVGHHARVARIRDAVAELPGLRVCGAAYDGVGIPAVVADARRAAEEIDAILPNPAGPVR